MFFRENPFYLLGVHSRDTAETIRTASLEKQGAAKSREEKHMYQLAEERLLHETFTVSGGIILALRYGQRTCLLID